MNNLYLRLALKNLLKKKSNTVVSILGLAIAFAAIFHIVSIVGYEKGYDGQNKKADRIYRISGDIIAAENTMSHAVLGPLMGPGLKDGFPAVESFVRLVPTKSTIKLELEDKSVFEVEEAYTADTSVFNIFTFSFVYGDASHALRNPDEIVINKSLSKKMFGDVDPLGKIIVRDGTPLTVAGVVEDSPENAHHHLNVLFSIGNQWADLTGIPATKLSEAYWMPSCYVFILLHKGAKIESITDNFQPFFEKNMSNFGKAINAKFSPIAIPLRDLHFSKNMNYDYPKGNRTYSTIFLIIGVFILSVGFLNYSNLLVSQNIAQSKNIGVRKINGAKQLDIYFQLFVNSTIIIAVSLVISILLYRLSIPLLNDISIVNANTISFGTISCLSLAMLFGLSSISSLIPFYKQKNRSGLELMSKNITGKMHKGQLSFGRVSTIAQLSLSIMLLISIMLIGKQLSFMTKSDMGFDKENVVLLKINKTICNAETVNSLKQEILRDPNIESVAFSTRAVGEVLGSFHFQIDKQGEKVTKIVNGLGIDYDYITLMNMEFSDGRNFEIGRNDDNFNSIIVNEAFVDFCGLASPAVGQELQGAKVVGVLKDVCFNSLKNETEPVVFFISEQSGGYLNIRVRAGANLHSTLESLNEKWASFFKDEPFTTQFLDNRVKMMYDDDFAKSKLIRMFTIITMLISLMGLFNISLLISVQRTKEIGIRKVNGATISEVLLMLNKDFIKWVAIAFVVATPIAYFAMNKWLENFAYKTTLSWWIFALAGVLALGIALLTVSFQSWKAANRNPVESLRYE